MSAHERELATRLRRHAEEALRLAVKSPKGSAVHHAARLFEEAFHAALRAGEPHASAARLWQASSRLGSVRAHPIGSQTRGEARQDARRDLERIQSLYEGRSDPAHKRARHVLRAKRRDPSPATHLPRSRLSLEAYEIAARKALRRIRAPQSALTRKGPLGEDARLALKPALQLGSA